MTDISLDNYYYGEQLKRYIIAFSAIFTALKVKIGKNNLNSASNFIRVPNTYGSRDEVVDAIRAGFTQNKPIRVPITSTYMSGFTLDPTKRVGTGTEIKDVRLPLGGALPNDLVVIHKYRPIPYVMNLDFDIWASNTDQHCQMMEQIMMLFTPQLEIQISDDFEDWTKKTTVELQDVVFNQEYPIGTARRVITSTFSFTMPIQLSPPINLKTDFIKEMKLKMSIAGWNQNVHTIAEESAREADETDYEILLSADDNKSPIVVSATLTPTPTPSFIPSATPTNTPTVTPSMTITPTQTVTPSI